MYLYTTETYLAMTDRPVDTLENFWKKELFCHGLPHHRYEGVH